MATAKKKATSRSKGAKAAAKPRTSKTSAGVAKPIKTKTQRSAQKGMQQYSQLTEMLVFLFAFLALIYLALIYYRYS